MSSAYLGKLNYADPLYEVLLLSEFSDIRNPVFHVSKLSHSRVFKYTEEKSRISVVGKFFNLNDSCLDRVSRIKCEYDNLHKVRDYGFDTYPNYVVRPICREDRIGLALIEEFIAGEDLDFYLRRAIYHGESRYLKKILSGLATFLYMLHKRTKCRQNVDLEPVILYFLKVIKKLGRQSVIDNSEQTAFFKLMDRWVSRTCIQKVKNVIIHGDATPTNFIFANMVDVVAIDLERMKVSDAAYDIGMIAGEIKHAFLWRTGSYHASEPFIRHFLKSYASCFRDRKKAFHEITFRNPFYMGLTELRISRNNYLPWDYRRKLAHEAMECLKWGLKL